MSKLNQLFKEKPNRLCSVYFTSGYPKLNDTATVVKNLEAAGVDFLEVGFPYSDPMADGPTIQESSSVALKNGVNLDIIFDQLAAIKEQINIPLVGMGYLNQMLRYGTEKFCEKCISVGIETLILPDMPMIEYETIYKDLFAKYGLTNVFLITPQTSEERIKKIDEMTNAFIYVVASSSITGAKGTISEEQIAYFNRIKSYNLKSTLIAGFGISSKETFNTVCSHVNGAIIGSAFVKHVGTNGVDTIDAFVKNIIN
ncbi:tryptophan synthase subunit alpha [Wenyingzhuangia fucanilytica]|uniref:Tryptophan synthase alpha chain n=1 Tax=Wenyingzhuangia fucanilytica TaxID=1790137 RepID=A0A1B1Y285_9FLAO|nr:tryptophan synthase subunit alpha [Wenyingzhuangia fucanilytica]ANW94883.1 tryptophan synthase subunit alpha [Wenyingzhuangia fucanilytica]